MDEPIQVALALVRSAQGWLVSRRSAGRLYAGLWEFPGGKLEPGESPAEGAVREVREETGLVVEAVASLGEVWNVQAGRPVTLHLVHCRTRDGEARACDPAVEAVRWVSLDELAELAMPPVNAGIVERLRALESA